MPRRKLSLSELTESGTLARNRRHYASRILSEACPRAPLGRVPTQLPIAERAAWREIVKVAAPGSLVRTDRILLEIAARLVVRFRATVPKASEVRLLASVLTSLGITTSDRTNLAPSKTVADSQEDAAWADL